MAPAPISMMQTLVTGGSGFIGQHLVALLVRDRRVRILDLRPPACTPEGLQYVKGSVLDSAVVREAIDGVEEIYHLAALPGMWIPHKDDFHAVNCVGTEIMITAARECGIQRFLHCSTESILFSKSSTDTFVTEQASTTLDEMPGPYTRSKLLAEQSALHAAATGFPIVIASPTMPIGPHQGNLTPPNLMLEHFLARRLQFYLDFTMNLVDVRDVAAGMVLAMRRGQIGHRYVLGGEDISLRQLLEVMGTISGRKSIRVPITTGIAEATAAIMEFFADRVTRRSPSATVEAVRIALRSKALSIEKSRRELGYAPRPLETTLREAISSISVGV
jgi:dihydroflavonol-4-reductase